MFGYLRIQKSSLSLQQRKIYRDYYCSLCLALTYNYGRHAKLLTSYDVAYFMLILFPNNLKLEPCGRCGRSIQNRRCCFSQDFFHKAAMYQMTLIRMKLIDNIVDQHATIRSKLIYKLFLLIYPKCRETDRYMHYMNEYIDLERNAADIHERMRSYESFIAGPLYEIFHASREKIDLIVSLCKWIYYIDAIDDYDRDLMGERFNLVITDFKRYNSKKELLIYEMDNLEHRLNDLILDIQAKYRKELFNRQQRIILENLIWVSIPKVTVMILNGEKIPHEKLL